MKKIICFFLQYMLVMSMIISSVQSVYAENEKSPITAGKLPYNKMVCENETLQLWMNESGGIAVKNKKNDFIYTSNPVNALNDPIAITTDKMKNLLSQMYVDVVDQNGGTAVLYSENDSVIKGGVTYKPANNGVTFVYDFPEYGVTIPVRYTLEDDHFNVEIPIKEVIDQKEVSRVDQKGAKYTLNYRVNQISLLPYFGAAGTEDKGYIFVPDGSGALINFNNNKSKYGSYSQPVYGKDNTFVVDKLNGEQETIRMPVFGMKNGDTGFLAVIQDGESVASITAQSSGSVSSYNNVYPGFRFRVTDFSVFSKNSEFDTATADARVLAASSNPINLETYSVKYYFMNKKDLSYVDLAKVYRDYLIKYDHIGKLPANDSVPLFLNLYGGLEKEKYILGFKFNVLEPLTKYREAVNILKALKSNGVDGIALKYTGWQKGGMISAVPSKIAYENKLGGQKNFEDFVKYSNDNGVSVFLDFDYVNLYKSGNGYSVLNDSVQTVPQTPSYQYTYDYNTKARNLKSRWDLLSPRRALEAFETLSRGYSKLGIKNISLSNLGDKIYSDFTKKRNGIERSDTVAVWQEILSKAQKNMGKVMVDHGNSYVFPYASDIYDAPLESSKFDIEDETVPFYQIVLHGYISYSTAPLNLVSDPEYTMLKALETGSNFAFSLMYADSHVLSRTRYENVFSANYETWLDTAADYYKKTKQVFAEIQGQEIVGHKKLKHNVYRTEYENGLIVYVNYDSDTETIDGTSIDGKSFVVKKEK